MKNQKQGVVSREIERQLSVAHEVERHAMERSQAVLCNASPVFGCRVSCIMIPSVIWILSMKRAHIFVAMSLGKY